MARRPALSGAWFIAGRNLWQVPIAQDPLKLPSTWTTQAVASSERAPLAVDGRLLRTLYIPLEIHENSPDFQSLPRKRGRGDFCGARNQGSQQSTPCEKS